VVCATLKYSLDSAWVLAIKATNPGGKTVPCPGIVNFHLLIKVNHLVCFIFTVGNNLKTI
jgi:hypothetical protein